MTSGERMSWKHPGDAQDSPQHSIHSEEVMGLVEKPWSVIFPFQSLSVTDISF